MHDYFVLLTIFTIYMLFNCILLVYCVNNRRYNNYNHNNRLEIVYEDEFLEEDNDIEIAGEGEN